MSPINPSARVIRYGETQEAIGTGNEELWTFTGSVNDVVAIRIEGDSGTLSAVLNGPIDGLDFGPSLQFERSSIERAVFGGTSINSQVRFFQLTKAPPGATDHGAPFSQVRCTIRITAQSDYKIALASVKGVRELDLSHLDWVTLPEGTTYNILLFDADPGDMVNVIHQDIAISSNCHYRNPKYGELNPNLHPSLKITTLVPSNSGRHLLFLAPNAPTSAYFVSFHQDVLHPEGISELIASQALAHGAGLLPSGIDAGIDGFDTLRVEAPTERFPSGFAGFDDLLIEALWKQAESAYIAGNYDQALEDCKRLLLQIVLWRARYSGDPHSIRVGEDLANVVPPTWRFLFDDEAPDAEQTKAIFTKLSRKGVGEQFEQSTGEWIVFELGQESQSYYFCRLPLLVGDIYQALGNHDVRANSYLPAQSLYWRALQSYTMARDSPSCDEEVSVWVGMARAFLSIAETYIRLNSGDLTYAQKLLSEIADKNGVMASDSSLYRLDYPGIFIFQLASSQSRPDLPDLIGQLDQGVLSNELRVRFRDNGKTISPEAEVEVVDIGAWWRIVDGSKVYNLLDEEVAPNEVRFIQVYMARTATLDDVADPEVIEVLRRVKMDYAIIINRLDQALEFSLEDWWAPMNVPALRWEKLLERAEEYHAKAKRSYDDYLRYLTNRDSSTITEAELTKAIDMNKEALAVEELELQYTEIHRKNLHEEISTLERTFLQTQYDNFKLRRLQAEIDGFKGPIIPLPGYERKPEIRLPKDETGEKVIILTGNTRNGVINARSIERDDIIRVQQQRALENTIYQAKREEELALNGVLLAEARRDLAQQRVKNSEEIQRLNNGREIGAREWSDLTTISYYSMASSILHAIKAANMLKTAFEFEFGVSLPHTPGFAVPVLNQDNPVALAEVISNIESGISKLEDHYIELSTYQEVGPVDISFRKEFPIEFEMLMRNGSVRFNTTLEFFQELFPGSFNHRIKDIHVDIDGVGGPESIILENSGYSYYRLPMPGTLISEYSNVRQVESTLKLHPGAPPKLIYDTVDGVAIPPPIAGDHLSVFENIGLGTGWNLMITTPKGLPRNDIFDVILKIAFSCNASSLLKTQDCLDLPNSGIATTTFSLGIKYRDDGWSSFNQQGEMEFEILREDISYSSPALLWLKLIAANTDGVLLDVPLCLARQEDSQGSPQWVEHRVEWSEDMIGQIPTLILGTQLVGKWRLRFESDDESPHNFRDIKDVVLLTKYQYTKSRPDCGGI